MKTRHFISIIALAMASCATSQVVHTLTPEAPEGHFEMGREYIPLSNEGLRVELGFDGIYEQNLVFDVVVLNNSDQPLSLDPADFYYEILDSADAETSAISSRYSVHPEEILGQFEEELDNWEIEKNINSIFGFIESGIGFIANASAFLSTENPAYIIDAVFSTAGTAGHYVGVDRQISHEMEQVNLEKEVVLEEILRKGNIPPGEVASGFVFFPRYSGDAHYMFCIPLEDQLFQFVYRQKRELED